MTKKQKKHRSITKKSYPSVVGIIVTLLLVVLLFSINNYAFGKMLFGTSFGFSAGSSKDIVERPSSSQIDIGSTPNPLSSHLPTLTPTPEPSPTPLIPFSPLPLVPVPEDDLQARKDAFNQKAKEFAEKAKAEGVSNTAIANTIRFQYELEFGTNANSQMEYSNCLISYNTKLSEYNACMLSGSYGCYMPVNSCFKPLDAGF